MGAMQQVNPRLLDVERAAYYIGRSPSYLNNGRSKGIGSDGLPPPRFCQVGRMVAYDVRDLDEWIDNLPRFTSVAESATAKAG